MGWAVVAEAEKLLRIVEKLWKKQIQLTSWFRRLGLQQISAATPILQATTSIQMYQELQVAIFLRVTSRERTVPELRQCDRPEDAQEDWTI